VTIFSSKEIESYRKKLQEKDEIIQSKDMKLRKLQRKIKTMEDYTFEVSLNISHSKTSETCMELERDKEELRLEVDVSNCSIYVRTYEIIVGNTYLIILSRVLSCMMYKKINFSKLLNKINIPSQNGKTFHHFQRSV